MSGRWIEFVLSVIAGILAGVAAGKSMKEHGLGIFVDAGAGGAGAALGYLFLRDQVLLIVNASGDMGGGGTSLEQTTLLVIAGAIEGAILALGAGIVKMMISEHSPK